MKVIEDLESAQLNVKFLSEYDPLTMLYNRRTFERYVRETIERSSRTGSMFSIVLMDIDDFRIINDVYGPQTADMVLKELSERLKRTLGEWIFRRGLEGMSLWFSCQTFQEIPHWW
jgi:diguanylate cyclase (GGDEF)-like protein